MPQTLTAAHVTLLDIRLELVAKVYRFVRVLPTEKAPERVDKDIGVVVGFHEPVEAVKIVAMHESERLGHFVPQLIAVFLFQCHCQGAAGFYRIADVGSADKE